MDLYCNGTFSYTCWVKEMHTLCSFFSMFYFETYLIICVDGKLWLLLDDLSFGDDLRKF